jgi:ubiquinone/menaquinone biosynthesis C-methylase UbiE
MLTEIYRVLKPGGQLILTVDLFLNVHPFEPAQSNEYGHNVSIKWMTEVSGWSSFTGPFGALRLPGVRLEAISATAPGI